MPNARVLNLKCTLPKNTPSLYYSISTLEHDAIKSKLMALEKKIIVGGENLLEKAQERAFCR